MNQIKFFSKCTNSEVHFKFHQVLLISGFNDNKHDILQEIYEGFSGKNSNFIFNNLQVDPIHYQVIYISNPLSILSSFKLIKSSPIRLEIIQQYFSFSDDTWKPIEEQFTNLINKYIDTINQKLFVNNDVKLKHINANFEKILDKFLELEIMTSLEENANNFVSPDKVKLKILKLIYLKFFENLHKNQNFKKVFIISFPENELNIKEKLEFITQIKNNSHNIYILFTNSQYLLKCTTENIYLINSKYQLINCYLSSQFIKNYLCILEYIKSNEDNFDFFQYNFTKLILKEDVDFERKKLRVYIIDNFIFHLLTSDDDWKFKGDILWLNDFMIANLNLSQLIFWILFSLNYLDSGQNFFQNIISSNKKIIKNKKLQKLLSSF